MSTTITDLTRLLEAFSSVKPNRRQPTFLEIAGYPHLENVCSNILAFYLHPENAHGMGDLMLGVLQAMLPVHDFPPAVEVDIRREETTQHGKRIDIVVDAGSYVIAIENKIYHSTNNPFEEYHRHLEHVSAGRPSFGVLLSLRPPERAAVELHGFYPVSYRDFFGRVRDELSPRPLRSQEPYVSLLRDVAQTFADLDQEASMDVERRDFFKNNRGAIESLLAEVKLLHDEMLRKLREVANKVDTAQLGHRVHQDYWPGKTNLYDILHYQVTLNDALDINITINLSPRGWGISVFNERGDRHMFEEWLEKHEIVTEFRQATPYRRGYGADDLDYDAPLDAVAGRINGLFQQISLATLPK